MKTAVCVVLVELCLQNGSLVDILEAFYAEEAGSNPCHFAGVLPTFSAERSTVLLRGSIQKIEDNRRMKKGGERNQSATNRNRRDFHGLYVCVQLDDK